MKNPDNACTVLVISSNYPRFSGDICGWFIHEISRRIVQKEYRVIALTPHSQNSRVHEIMDGVDVQRFIYFYPERFENLAYGSGILYNLRNSPVTFFTIFLFLISELFTTGKIVHKHQVNFIHTHWLLPQGLIGALFHYLMKIPHIATIHGSDLNLINTNLFLKLLCRFIIKNSDAITVNSSYMKQQLLCVVPDSLQKIHIIPMGVDPVKYQKTDTSDAKWKLGTKHIILSVGRLIDWKGTIHLIDSMPMVLQHVPDTLLLIIGSGPEKEHLEQRIRELSLEGNVQFLGTVSDQELQEYYHLADVFVLPSINKSGKTEGLGVVLLEAMASGCPVIGSNVGGIPDIIIDGENGFLVPEQDSGALGNRIVRILSDEDIGEKFRKNGYIRIGQSFTWDSISERFLAVFSQVYSQQKPFEYGEIP